MACNKIAGAHKLYYIPYQASGVLPEYSDLVYATHYLGTTGEEGIRVNRDISIQDITTDELGPGTIVDGVYQGSNMEIEFVVQDVNTEIVQALLHPFQQTLSSTAYTGIKQENVGVAGVLACARFGSLFALPIVGTGAAGFSAGDGALLSATVNGRQFVGISVGPIVESLDTTPRFIPVRFRCYPFFDDNDSNLTKHYRWCSQAQPS